jgi:RNA polymerase sigma factor (sigma-70 family)
VDSSTTARFPTVPVSKAEDPKRLLSIKRETALEPSDGALLLRITSGDREALGLLFQRYARPVRSIGRRILRDDSEADDLVQDIFLFIQRKCSIFDSSKSSAGSWIVQMAYQRAIERRRRLAARHFYKREDLQSDGSRVVGTPTIEHDYSPEAVFGRNGLEKIIGALSEHQRETLRLYFFEGYTLSAIYHIGYTEVLSCFGLPIGDLGRYRASIGIPKTHLLGGGADIEAEKVSLPVRFKPEFQLEKTNLLAQVVEKWDQIPVGFLQHLDLHKSVYGYIGLEDFTLYPLIRPGSLVQIDVSQRKISTEKWKSEFDRPIYFVEHRVGYVCSWCQVDRGQLIIIPHPQSHQDIRRFDYPSQAEIVGRVTGVAMRIVEERAPGAGETVRSVHE